MGRSHVTTTSWRRGENRAAAFTIVELLVVIAIVAVLAAIVLVNVTSYIAKSRRSAVEGDLSTMLTNASSYNNNSSSGYTGFHTDPTYLNPKVAIENITGTNTVVENETSTAFCACAPLPDIPGSASQTWCVDSTGNKTQTAVLCSDECQSSGSCINTSVSGGILNGLVAYWKLDESSGTAATDSSGNGNNGIYNGTTASTSVPVPPITFADPRSRSFNGTSDYNSAGIISELNNSTIAICAWANESSSPASFTQVVGDSNGQGAIFVNNSGQFFGQFTFTAAGNVGTSPISVSAGWHHFCATWSNGNPVKFYVDGVLSQSSSSVTDSLVGWRGVWLGRYVSGSYFPGLIDDVRIYNRALSASEVATLAAGN